LWGGILKKAGHALAARRLGYKGTACSDIEGVPWSVECTRTKNGEKRLGAKWSQAVRNAKLEGQEPILIMGAPRQKWQDNLVMMRGELFVALVDAQGIPHVEAVVEEVGGRNLPPKWPYEGWQGGA
jgi:hypothetical protein